jgi:putative photosynthetic complex assembly protein 2
MTLSAVGTSIGYTIFVWWFSTGAILWLDRRPQRFHGFSFALISAVAAASLVGLWLSLDDATPGGAVLGFTCALGLWGWHEASFLMGFVTGPSLAPCPAEARGLRRFRLAAATLIYHEIALALTLIALAAFSWGQANPVGLCTFGVLFMARLSAKLNLFLGVPNFSMEFFPDRLRYLTSYLRKSSGNALFPLSMVAGAVVIWIESRGISAATATPYRVVSQSLLLALTALAVLEHLFMVLPVPDTTLWRWALPASPDTARDQRALDKR